jgi:hypothetical protein
MACCNPQGVVVMLDKNGADWRGERSPDDKLILINIRLSALPRQIVDTVLQGPRIFAPIRSMSFITYKQRAYTREDRETT